MSNYVENGQDLQKFIWIFKGSFNFISIYNFPKMICHYLKYIYANQHIICMF
jgi:hypothetical protein